MDYTLLSDDYKEYNNNIFRILDEITSCINSIKNKLQKEGFNEIKLDIALGGYSSGAHLALLYGYSMNNASQSPIPNPQSPFVLELIYYYLKKINYFINY